MLTECTLDKGHPTWPLDWSCLGPAGIRQSEVPWRCQHQTHPCCSLEEQVWGQVVGEGCVSLTCVAPLCCRCRRWSWSSWSWKQIHQPTCCCYAQSLDLADQIQWAPPGKTSGCRQKGLQVEGICSIQASVLMGCSETAGLLALIIFLTLCLLL